MAATYTYFEESYLTYLTLKHTVPSPRDAFHFFSVSRSLPGGDFDLAETASRGSALAGAGRPGIGHWK